LREALKVHEGCRVRAEAELEPTANSRRATTRWI